MKNLKIKKKKEKILLVIGILVLFYPITSTVRDAFLGRIPYGYVTGEVVDAFSDKDRHPIGEIIDGNTIRQYFRLPDRNEITCIILNGATYKRENHSMLVIRLFEVQHMDNLKTWEIDTAQMKDNSEIKLDIGEIDYDFSSKEYMIEIFSDGAQTGNAVTLFACSKDVYPDGSLQMNGEKQTENLCVKILGITEKKSYLYIKVWFRIYASAVLEVILYLIYIKLGGTYDEAIDYYPGS